MKSLLATSVLMMVAPAMAFEAWEGYTLYNPTNGQNTHRTTLIDNDEQIIHQWFGADSIASTPYLMPGGELIRPCRANGPMNGAAKGGRIQRIALDGTILWDYTLSDENNQPHHDICVMPNGNILMVAWERKTQAEGQAAGRQNLNSEIWPTQILEVEPTGPTSGDIVWEWHLWDHMVQDISASYPNYGVISEHPEKFDINKGNVGQGSSPGDWIHVNALDYHPELDQIVFSSNQLDEIFIIDHGITTEEAAGPAGDILYRWGNPSNYERTGAHVLWNVHGVNWIDEGLEGENNLLLFNNGNDDFTSDVIEFIPPLLPDGTYGLDTGQAYEPVPGDYVFFYEQSGFHGNHLCGVYKLPNGNYLATDGPNNEIREIESDGSIAWQHFTPSDIMRANKYSLDILDPVSEHCDGDANGDGQVDVNDILEVVGAYGSNDGSGDADGDGDSDASDILVILATWGSNCD
ncbi:MAG: aryl-sulfate sulfotransferase [Phycisphaerales bacterium]|nr:aryl-sulfate sulfotransferase [Phycisphaerales bacterium]